MEIDPATLPEKGQSLQFSALVYGQTAAWIKMPLDTEVGLGLGDIVLYVDPAPPPLNSSTSPKGARPPIFGQCPLWPNSRMD